MPRFYDLFKDVLVQKETKWRDRYHELPKGIELILSEELRKWWINSSFRAYERKPSDFTILAIDSSYQMERLQNGGLFYVVRALGINGNNEHRLLEADFDYTEGSAHEVNNVLQRKMEYLEIKLAAEAISNGFSGVILIDGSLYGRISHLMMESPLSNDRDFFIRYYQEILNLFKLARENNVMLIGISKESGSRFFRDFLMKQIVTLPEVRGEVEGEAAKQLISLALDKKREAIEYLNKLKTAYEDIGLLDKVIKELMTPRPDYQLIEAVVDDTGYTTPLLLGPSKRWIRGLAQIEENPMSYLKSHFPILSNKENFINSALEVIKNLRELPSIISFHVLLDKRDSPLRIDVPAFCLGISKKFYEIGWPEPIDKEDTDVADSISEVLSIVATGYGGLEYHNIWLWKVDKKVKFHRSDFDNMYLSKFKELVGVSLNARDYRRVRFV